MRQVVISWLLFPRGVLDLICSDRGLAVEETNISIIRIRPIAYLQMAETYPSSPWMGWTRLIDGRIEQPAQEFLSPVSSKL